MGVLTRWTVFPTDHPTLGKVYLGAAGQRCRLTGFEPLDRLSSTNCLSWQPWQGNAWPYSWNPKRQFFSAMFSEQMRYILYFWPVVAVLCVVWKEKEGFLQRWVGVIYPGDRGCFVLTTPNALTDILDSLTSTDILAAGLLEFFTSMDYTYKSYQVCAGTRYFGVYYYVTLRSPLAVRLPKILPERGPLPIIPYQVFRVV